MTGVNVASSLSVRNEVRSGSIDECTDRAAEASHGGADRIEFGSFGGGLPTAPLADSRFEQCSVGGVEFLQRVGVGFDEGFDGVGGCFVGGGAVCVMGDDLFESR